MPLDSEFRLEDMARSQPLSSRRLAKWPECAWRSHRRSPSPGCRTSSTMSSLHSAMSATPCWFRMQPRSWPTSTRASIQWSTRSCGDPFVCHSSRWDQAVLRLNSCVNPVVYALMWRPFRLSLIQVRPSCPAPQLVRQSSGLRAHVETLSSVTHPGETKLSCASTRVLTQWSTRSCGDPFVCHSSRWDQALLRFFSLVSAFFSAWSSVCWSEFGMFCWYVDCKK